MSREPSKLLAKMGWSAIIVLGLVSLATRCVHKADANKGFAVVELFTSEGCSSCPSADALVAKIQQESNDLPVYILAYHVDYWNRLGWKDSFSSAACSERQGRYTRWLNAQLYTPQVVVNGRKEFVGSAESTLRSTISNELQKVSPARLALYDVKREEKKITMQYRLEGGPANALLLLALVEKKAVSKILSGENSGRTLSHVQIVRNMQTIPLKEQGGAAMLEVPDKLDQQNLEVIAFLQHAGTGEIVAATKSSINSSPAGGSTNR